MATVLGVSARYVSDQSTKKLVRILFFLYIFGCGISVVGGYLLAAKEFFISVLFIVIAPLSFIYIDKKLVSLEKERLSYRKGATGEATVGIVLENFPDEYRVIHDLTTPYGNIDHIVIGPSGVYVIDT